MPITGYHLVVNRSNLPDARIDEASFPDTPSEGECLLAVDGFALTANNITYAVASEKLGYWKFFPHPQEGMGRIPAWGFAEVVASAAPGVEVGERVFGFLPMSTHLLVRPGHVAADGFTDVTAHRQGMSPIYNRYGFTRVDPLWKPEHEWLISLFRPLFTTSCLLDDLHRSRAYFGASSLIVSSASAKTSIGLAFLLARSKPASVSIIGLTSGMNQAFVKGLGCYDAVLSYRELGELPVVPSAFIDIAGNGQLRRALHENLRDDLKSSYKVGYTHWEQMADEERDLPGPRPELFKTSTYAQERIGTLGLPAFLANIAEAWTAFTPAAKRWFTVTEHRGPQAALEQYRATLRGALDPARGHIVSLSKSRSGWRG